MQKTPCDDTSSHGAFRFPFIMFKEIVNGKIILDEGNNGSYKSVPHQNHEV